MKQKKFKRIHAIILLVVVIIAAVSTFFIVRHYKGGQGYRTISVVEVSGNVSVVKDGIEYSAYSGMMLQEGYEIITGGKSYVRMVLDNDKYIKLESGSKAVFETLGALDSGKTRIKLERGSITSEIVKPLNQDEEFVINTPNAVLSVRGTFFRVDLNAEKNGEIKADVMTYGGKVASQRIKPSGEIVEEEVLIDAGFKATINMSKEDTNYVVEDENGDLVIVEPVAPDNQENPGDGDNQGQTMVLPTQPIKIEEIPDDDLVDMYFAVDNGHEMFVTIDEAKAKIEERAIDLEEKKSVYVIAAESKQEKTDVIANDSKPIVKEEETTSTDENLSVNNPLTDGDGHTCKATFAGMEQCHSKCNECGKIMSTEHNFIEEVKISATCLLMGEMLHVCECGYRYTTDLPATGHTAIDGGTLEGHKVCKTCDEVLDNIHTFVEEVTLLPGCTTTGKTTHSCDCGYVYETEISATGHSAVKGGTEEGHSICEICNGVLDSVHNYTDTIILEATCDTDGTMSHVCDCGYTYSTVIPATKHTEVMVGTKDAHSKCNTCNQVIRSTHLYTSVVTTEATCTAKGVTTHTCDCGYSYTTEIAATGHSAVAGGTESVHSKCSVCNTTISSEHSYISVVTTEATCTGKGVTTHTCDCGYSYTTEIAATGHSSVLGGTADVHYKCEICNETLSAAHSYTSTVTTEPTCTTAGVLTYSCDCGHTYTNSIDANGHTETAGGTSGCHAKCSVCNVTLSTVHTLNETVDTPAECTVDGVMKHACDCGYQYTSVIAHTGHTKVDDVDITNCTNCGIQLVMLNSTNFPDSVLLTYLTGDSIDIDGDDMLDGDELGVITELEVPEGVTDTAGIQHLTSMTIIDLSNNTTLDNLNVSGYVNGRLEVVGDAELTAINLLDSVNLRVADLTGVASVESISADNISSLIRIDMGDFADCLTSLTYNETGITELDVSELSSLTSLDVTDNSELTSLIVDDLNITEIDLAGLDSLQTFTANRTMLTGIDLTEVADTLTTLSLYSSPVDTITWPTGSAKPVIEMLDVSYTNITALSFNGVFDSLQTIVCGSDKLNSFEFVGGSSSALKSLTISGAFSMTSFTLTDSSYFVSIQNLDLSTCVSLENVVISGLTSMTSLSLPTSNTINTLEVTTCSSLSSINIRALSLLKQLNVSGSGLTSLDIENNTVLEALDISNTAIDSIDATDHLSLESINARNCTSLVTLDVNKEDNWRSPLNTIDITGCTALETLDLSFCENLTSVDITTCTNLTWLSIKNTAMTSIDLSNSSNLETLFVYHLSGLTELDLSNCTSLADLGASNTGLTRLDISGTSMLSIAIVECNDMTEFIATGVTTLERLYADKNQRLSSLNLTGCTRLSYVNFVDTPSATNIVTITATDTPNITTDIFDNGDTNYYTIIN